MIKRTFDITARIEQGQPPFCFQAVQNDKDVYVLRIRITEGDEEIDYTQVSSATITFALANGAVVQSDPTRLTVSATGIIYQMGTSEIACPGKVLASIQLFGSSGERLTTARFQFEVVADLITPGAVQSESRFPLLQQLVADVEQLKQDIVNLQIPNGSIMDVKLSNAAGQIKQRFASHLADNMAHGLQQVATISLLNGWTLPENKVFSVVKNGNIVTISGELLAGAITDWTDIFILPEGFRPPKIMQIAQKGHGTSFFSVLIADIGNFQIYNSNGISAGDTVVPFNITFSL